jgi:putative DNA primase/helicase
MQKIAGLCLTGRTDFQSLFILHGEGKNGKGCYCRTLDLLLGDYGVPIRQEVLMATKGEHPTALADLYGRRAVFAGETDQDCRLNENQVKTLSGDDKISCRRMREDNWSFMPTHKIILATNYLPLIRGTDHGIWRRIRIIPFNAQCQHADRYLEEIHIPNELSGILNWALEGYQKILELENAGKDGLEPPACVLAANKSYRADMDIVQQFVEDKCLLGPAMTVSNSRLYQSFRLYCESLGQYVPSHRKLTQDLHKMGVKTKVSDTERFKIGIGLRSEFEDLDPEQVF